MNKRLLVAALLICAVFSQCEPKSDLPNLQSGSVNFAVNSKGSSITTATFQQNFQSTFSQTPGVAFSLQAFNVNSPSISDWSVFTQSVQSNGFVAAFRHRPSEWTSVRVGFWASARPDLVVGAITAQFSSLKAGSAPVLVNLENGLINPNTSISRAFLTGYTAKSGSEIFIRTFDKSISANRLQLGVQVGGNMQITSARVNYIVFSPSTAVFASYGGGVSQSNFSQSKLYNFQKFVHNSPYAFFGIANLRQSASSKVTALNVRFDKDFYMRVDSLLPIQSFFLSYLVVGVNPSTSCSACNDRNIYENSCVAKCPDNSYQVVYRDGGKGCRMCPSQYNMVVNDGKTGCVCRSGFSDRNGLCVSADGSTQASSSTQTSSNALPAGVTAAIVNKDTLVVRPVSTPVSVSASSGVPIRNTVIVSSSSSSSSSSSAPIISSAPIFSAPLTDTSQSFIAKAPTPAVPKSDPEQFYVPTAPVQNSSSQLLATSTAPVVSQPIISPSAPQTVRPQDCSNNTNTYWTGYRCACRVGYALVNGFCAASQINSDRVFRPAEFIYKISLLYRQRPNNQCTKLNEVFNGQICDCAPGHTRGTQGDCRPDNDKCDNGNFVSGVCVCNNGFENKDGSCVPISSNTCEENSYKNQFGQCICVSGYVKRDGKCVAGNTCPPYSDPDSKGVCQCWQNYKKFDGINCSRCPAGQIWLYGECTTTCGINEQVNSVTGKCECNPGFGVYDGVCNNCPSDFFILNGYCVTCPLYASYDSQQRKCVCGNGLSLVGGICKDKCTNPNEVYSQLTNKCSCFDGLGRVGGICQICPTGRINPQTEQCISGCDTNEVLQGGSCNCRSGTGRDGSGKCSDCTQIQGGFLSNGFCVVCPKNQIPVAGKCGCEAGKTLNNGACVSTCKVDQLVDDQGNCYTCPINEVLSQGKCNCKNGYQRINGFCQINCPVNTYVVNERCVYCMMGTGFDPVLKQCVCPQGQYMNTYQVCEPIKKTCRAGTFLQGSDCVVCSAGCSQCSSANTCTVCQNRGFYPSGPTCLTRCGDGIRAGNEACDDGNLKDKDGCSSSCTVQQIIPQPPTPPTPPTPPQDSGLNLIGKPTYNYNNVFTILRTSIPIDGLTEAQKRSFIKYNFEDRSTEPTSVFCMQKASDRFECLFVYASGVPNKVYSANFSYNHRNTSGSLRVPYNPLTSMINTRSLNIRDDRQP